MAIKDSGTILIGISGVSSSGKTTLSRLIRDIYPNTFILHEDDFYYPDAQIPIKNGVADWDCLESIDVQGLQKVLKYIKEHGTSPPDFVSKEDQNSVGETKVDEAVVKRLKEEASVKMKGKKLRIAIIDGFLLFSEEMKSVWEEMDVRLFLRTEYVITSYAPMSQYLLVYHVMRLPNPSANCY
jgi:nicotinamide/nicotinate riboside kinase